GLVSVAIREAQGKIVSCELAAPQPVSFGKTILPERVASAVSLHATDISTETHPPLVTSVGLPFVITELKDLAALGRARANISGLDAIIAQDVRPSMYVYVNSGPSEIRSRMFAPLGGVSEDPATGSAACALAGLLAHRAAEPSGAFRWRITQGVEMGRPSTLLARAEKGGGTVQGTWVGGASVLVSEGVIHVD